MSSIGAVVIKAIHLGQLTAEAESTICQLVGNRCNPAEIEALALLQTAIQLGQVTRASQLAIESDESREA